MLVVCAACRRHVRDDEPSCPFCGGARIERRRAPDLGGRRLDRFALITFGASLAACGNGSSGAVEPKAPAPVASAEPVPSASSSAPSASSSAPSTPSAPSAPLLASSTPGVSAYGAPFPGPPGLVPPAPGSLAGAYGAPPSPPPSAVSVQAIAGTSEDTDAFRKRVAMLRVCFDQQLKTNPSVGNQLCKVDVSIGGDGKPTGASPVCKGLPALEACVRTRSQLIRFEPGVARTCSVSVLFTVKN